MASDWLHALIKAAHLKATPRRGWIRKGVEHPESVAAHSWGISFLVLNTLPADMNMERSLSYAIVHDLAESITGDFTPMDQVPSAEKNILETKAMKEICNGLERGPSLFSTWLNYERQADPESIFVRQLDRLDMAIQALIYGGDTDEDFSEFLTSAETIITDPSLVPLMTTIREAHERIRAEQSTLLEQERESSGQAHIK